MAESRLPYVLAMIERMGLDAFLAAECARVGTEPVPMRLADAFARRSLKLTPEEVRILSLFAAGLTRLEVGHVLKISDGTLRDRVKRVYLKLGARNKAHALALATRYGYLR